MSYLILFALGAFMIVNVGCASLGSQVEKDPYLWLEEIESPKALDWVKAQNARTLDHFEKNPNFSAIQKEALTILSDQRRIPYISFRGDMVYNFWTDDKHPRGLFRRTTYADYKSAKPKWEILLDVDKLNATEGKSWVYDGCRFFKPDSKTCLLFLSDGGKDATEVREFDLKTKKFIPAPQGFFLPAAKMETNWADEDTLLVATDFGAGTLSSSGYPLEVKIWKRGTPLSEAPLLFKASKDHMMVYTITDCGPEGCEIFVGDLINFYQSQIYWWKDKKDLVKVELPPVYEYESTHNGFLYLKLIKDLTVKGQSFVKGSLVKMPLGDWENLTEVFKPQEKVTFGAIHFTKNHTYLSTLENVNPRVYRDGVLFPKSKLGNTYVTSLDPYSDRILISFENPLTPPSLYEWDDKGIAM